jgi:hypothetical protein
MMPYTDDHPGPGFTGPHVPDHRGQEIVVWDTSAINRLAQQKDRADLITRMNQTCIHRIPMYIFDEIAATRSREKRARLLETCRELRGDSEMIILISPWFLIQAGVRMFWEIGEVDWEVLLGPQEGYEEAVTSGSAFDDDLAEIQRAQNRNNLTLFEDYCKQVKSQFENLFRTQSGVVMRPDEVIAQARATGVVERNVRYYCESIVGYPVDSRDLEKFSAAFLPLRAMVYAFLLAHYHRDKSEPTSRAAGAIDLLAAVYLPICHTFVTDDQNQQSVLRDVVEYCSFLAEVVWFEGTFRARFHG